MVWVRVRVSSLNRKEQHSDAGIVQQTHSRVQTGGAVWGGDRNPGHLDASRETLQGSKGLAFCSNKYFILKSQIVILQVIMFP